MPLHIPPVSRRKFLTTSFLATSGCLFGFGRARSDYMGTPVDPDYFVLIADTHIDQSLSYTREGENVADNLRLELDCIDRTAPGNAKWQGVTKTLTYRAGGSSSLNELTDRKKGILRFRNFPNPFSTITIISYELPRAGEVSLLIFASDGRLVKSIAVSRWQQAGLHQALFDATGLPAGTYHCRLSVNEIPEPAWLMMVKR